MSEKYIQLKSMAKGIYELVERIENEQVKCNKVSVGNQCELEFNYVLKLANDRIEELEKKLDQANVIIKQREQHIERLTEYSENSNTTHTQVKVELNEIESTDDNVVNDAFITEQHAFIASVHVQSEDLYNPANEFANNIPVSSDLQFNDGLKLETPPETSHFDMNYVQSLTDSAAGANQINETTMGPSSNYQIKQKISEKNHKCQLCPKSFGRPSLLTVHLRTHTGERPYECGVCAHTFSSNYCYKSHMRTHTGERPYKCALCPLTFAQLSTKSSHERAHAGLRPFKCKLCDKKFARPSSRRDHIMKQHKDQLNSAT